jgi:hypothetical protein
MENVNQAKDKRGQIIGRIDIDYRLKIVEEKRRFGDLVIGEKSQKSYFYG